MEDDAAPPEAGDWIAVARTGRARGLKGEIYAAGRYPAEGYTALRRLWLRTRDGGWANEAKPLVLARARAYKDGLVFQFAGLDSIEAVQPLEHCEAVVRRSERPRLAPGEFYLADLVGCGVFDRASDVKLGAVTGWQEFGGPELLEVLPEGGRPEDAFWIPFVRSICVEIDPAGRRLVIDPPEGLLELNRAGSKEPGSDG